MYEVDVVYIHRKCTLNSLLYTLKTITFVKISMISLSDHVYSHKQTLMGHLQQLQLISIFPSPHSLKLYRLLTLYNLKT